MDLTGINNATAQSAQEQERSTVISVCYNRAGREVLIFVNPDAQSSIKAI